MVALPSSTAADNPSISSLNLVRVILLLPISVSQKPSCCASSFASSMRRLIMLSIIPMTLPNGLAPSWSAKRAKRWLLSRWPSAARKSLRRLRTPWLASAWWSPICTSAVPRLFSIRSRCFSALPDTSSEDRISTAFSMASISSLRSFCFSAKDSFFSLHSVLVDERLSTFSALTAWVEPSCFWLAAAFSVLRCFSTVFSSISFLVFSIESSRSVTTMSNACLEFISSFWVSPSFVLKSSCRPFSISTMLVDWNSYALASGAA
mmetsp:Transcript_59331/g.133659  ORF Transcript_59331/g.133659 Transcript_59331/m.133659 type:complete len:263 (-) Transcript_59331:676-1464(-)